MHNTTAPIAIRHFLNIFASLSASIPQFETNRRNRFHPCAALAEARMFGNGASAAAGTSTLSIRTAANNPAAADRDPED